MSITFSLEESKELTQRFLKASGKSTMEELLALWEEEIIEIEAKIENYGNFAIRDGKVLPLDLYGTYADGKFKDIDMILGALKVIG